MTKECRMTNDQKKLWLLMLVLMLGGCASGQKSVELFNGRDLSGWYTYTTATKGENPGIFVVQDGAIRINGGDGKRAYYGGIYTNESYESYRLTVGYKFAGPAHGDGGNAAGDRGLLFNCTGKQEG